MNGLNKDSPSVWMRIGKTQLQLRGASSRGLPPTERFCLQYRLAYHPGFELTGKPSDFSSEELDRDFPLKSSQYSTPWFTKADSVHNSH